MMGECKKVSERPHAVVSIVIPVYNDEKRVGHAIDSALAQTLRDVEVIVVDDGSSDGTPHVLKTYEGRVTCIRQDNHGVAAARNAGINASSGEYICFLDSDDTIMPKKSELQVAVLESRPDAGVCYSGWLDIEARDGRVLGDHSNPKPERDPSIDPFPPHFASFAATIRSQVLQMIGGFDERVKYAEDTDLWFRLWATGCQFVRLEGALGCRGITPDNKSKNVPVHHRYSISVCKRYFAKMGPRVPHDLRAFVLRRLHLEMAGYYLRNNQHDLGHEALQSAFRYDRQLPLDFVNLEHLLRQLLPKSRLGSAMGASEYSQAWTELLKAIGKMLEESADRCSAELSRRERSALAYAMSRHSTAANETWIARYWLLRSLLLGRGVLPIGAHWQRASKIILGPFLTSFAALLLRCLRAIGRHIFLGEAGR